MNDIDDRLADLLPRSAAAVEVRPDLDAVTAGSATAAPVVGLGRRPRDTRRLLALAAALLAVLGLATVAVMARSSDDARELAQASAGMSGRFPVFGHLPDELAGEHVEANDGAGTHQGALGGAFGDDVQTVRAALGKVEADGAILDIVQLAVAAQDAEDRPGPQPAQVEDLGGGYQLATDVGVLELRGPGTTVEVSGPPEAEALVRSIAGTALTATVGPDGAPILTLGDLPDGYTVIAPPTAPEPEQAEIAAPTSPPCDAPSRSSCDTGSATVVVETGVGAPELAIMTADLASPVDIAGSSGLMASSEGEQVVTRIAWTAPNGVTVSLWAMYDVDEALAIARGVALVDEATWRDTYPEWPEGEDPEDGSDAAAATEPLPPTTEARDPDAGATTTSEASPATTGAGTGAEAEIDAAFHTAFDADLPEEERFAAVEDGPALVEAGREAVARFPAAADSISVTVHDIDVVAADRATVVFELLYDDAQLLGRQTGEAVLLDGAWRVTRETRCAIIRQAGVACP